jgi:hypothetical protein
MIQAGSIEILKSLAQIEFEQKFYDFHNDFIFEKIMYEDNVLILEFRSTREARIVSIKFGGVEFVKVDFSAVGHNSGLTIDTLYKGRFLLNDELIEMKNDKGYFFLEFYEGQSIEFWAENLSII